MATISSTVQAPRATIVSVRSMQGYKRSSGREHYVADTRLEPALRDTITLAKRGPAGLDFGIEVESS